MQSKTKNVAARGNGDVLIAVDRITHGRGVNVLASVEMPERDARFSVDGFEGLAIVAKKNQAARGGHGAAAGLSVAHLWIGPGGLVRTEVEGQ